MFLFAVPSVWTRRKEKIGGETGDGMEATNYGRGRQLVPPKSRFSSLPLAPPTIFFLLLGRKEQKTQSFLSGSGPTSELARRGG